jgi:DNA-binding NarL/FixJ family response regulator
MECSDGLVAVMPELQTLHAGAADGYVPFSPRRDEWDPLGVLTEREREVLALMAKGFSNRAVCKELHLSAKTIEAYVSHIFAKLDLPPDKNGHRRVLAVLAFLRR